MNNIYNSVHGVLYKVPSVLKGLFICFKLSHVLNLLYPSESEHLWLFIQFFYNLHTKYDKKLPNVINLVNILQHSNSSLHGRHKTVKQLPACGSQRAATSLA